MHFFVIGPSEFYIYLPSRYSDLSLRQSTIYHKSFLDDLRSSRCSDMTTKYGPKVSAAARRTAVHSYVQY
ncbi:hypothetical protein C8Q74DRAFT_1226866 [Fomes fomentarius]|nr:hypothetical protein C8Q74DRAFT_1226866 [Fomes fomentarius]